MKSAVETGCSLPPGPQQGAHVDTVPQPHTWESHCHGASGRNQGVTTATQLASWLPGLTRSSAALPKGDTQDTPSASHGRQAGLTLCQTKHPAAHLL